MCLQGVTSLMLPVGEHLKPLTEQQQNLCLNPFCSVQLSSTGILSLQWSLGPQHRAGVSPGTQRRSSIIPLHLQLQQSHKVTFLQTAANLGNEAAFSVAQGTFLVSQEDGPGSKLDLQFFIFQTMLWNTLLSSKTNCICSSPPPT